MRGVPGKGGDRFDRRRSGLRFGPEKEADIEGKLEVALKFKVL